MNFHERLKLDYGNDCLGNIRLLEKTGIKQSCFRNHLRFSLHCKHHDITPVSLCLSSCVKGKRAENILKRAEKSLLNVRIGQIIHKLDHLDREKHRIEKSVFAAGLLSPDDKAEVISRVERSEFKEYRSSKQRQQQKFACLVERKSEQNKRKLDNNIASECISKRVKNCSQRIYSDPELCVLARGLNFAVTEPKLPVVDFITATDTACRNLSDTDASELRSKVVKLVSRPRKIDSIISDEERQAISTHIFVCEVLHLVRLMVCLISEIGPRWILRSFLKAFYLQFGMLNAYVIKPTL